MTLREKLAVFLIVTAGALMVADAGVQFAVHDANASFVSNEGGDQIQGSRL